MSIIRPFFALCALSLCALVAQAQSTPAVSNLTAFSVSNPTGNLVRGPDGALYGVTAPSTSITGGLVYRAAADGSSVATIYQIAPELAVQPQGGLTLGSDGLLYGTTRFGSTNDTSTTGTVFKLSPAGTGFTVIHRFAPSTGSNSDFNPKNTNGAYPDAELIEGHDGYLYGVTPAGGPEGTGVVFKVSRDGADSKVLHAFSADRCPGVTLTTVFLHQRTTTNAAPAVATTGNATYTISTGEITGQPAGWTIAVPAVSSGAFLWVIQATVSNATSTDTVANTEWSTPVLHAGAAAPTHKSALVCAYKRATALPTDAPGAVDYTFATGAWTPGNGWSATVPDGTDRLWVTAATAASTGASDGVSAAEWSGVVEIVSGGVAGSTINLDGASPTGQLVQDADGFIYGTAARGGPNGLGTVFRVGSDGSGFQVLRSFSVMNYDIDQPERDGATPLAGLTDGDDGFLYGVASNGGSDGLGLVFTLSPDGSTFAVRHHFDGETGARPVAELLLGSDGKLYGSTAAGGVTSTGTASTLGTLFSIDRVGTNFTRLHSFDGSVGSSPNSQLIQLGTADFAGTLVNNGNCGYGALFRYSGAGTTFDGDTRCGRKNNDNGGGHGGPALLVLLGSLAWLRRKVA